MNLAEAKARLSIPDLWVTLGLPGEPGSCCLSPFRDEKRASFSVCADGHLYFDFGEGEGGDAVDFLVRATGLSKAAACRKFIELASSPRLDIKTVGTRVDPTDRDRIQPREAKSAKPLARIDNLPKFLADLTPPYGRTCITRLGKLRAISPHSVELACERGLLAFCHAQVPGYKQAVEWVPESLEPAWVITDVTHYNAQVRFLNGDKWDHLKGKPKAKTWPGSCARWPVGITEAQPFSRILLVEGGPDLLAGLHFAQLGGLEDEIGVVAMLGAGMSIHEEALPLFAGKHVRLIPHVDPPGKIAADKWKEQLRSVGADIDTVNLEGLRTARGPFVKDLNDCCLIHPDDAAQLEGLFEQ